MNLIWFTHSSTAFLNSKLRISTKMSIHQKMKPHTQPIKHLYTCASEIVKGECTRMIYCSSPSYTNSHMPAATNKDTQTCSGATSDSCYRYSANTTHLEYPSGRSNTAPKTSETTHTPTTAIHSPLSITHSSTRMRICEIRKNNTAFAMFVTLVFFAARPLLYTPSV